MTRLGTQIRVIHALLIREMTTRFGGSSLGYLWALIEPVGVIALLVVIFSQIAHAPPVGRSFALFYATGFLAFGMWNDVAAVVGRSVHVNRPLLNYPCVTALDTVLARFVLQVLTSIAVMGIVLGTILAIFNDPVMFDPGPFLAAIGLAALLGLGVGTVNTVLFALSKGWEMTYGVISRPLFLVSCVFFTFGSMPGYVQDVLWYNPLIHLVGLMRAAFYPGYDAAYVSPAYLLFLGLGLTVTGLAAMRAGQARLAAP